MKVPDPACMTPEELAAWRKAADYVNVSWGRANLTEDPCSDCTMAFHLEMREEGRCNGIPGLARKPRESNSHNSAMQRRYYFRRILADKGLDPAHAESVA